MAHPRRGLLAARRLTHLAILLITLAIGTVVIVLMAWDSGLIERTSCTGGERAAFAAFPQVDGRFHRPAWNYEESRCWTEFPVPSHGLPVARYYQRQLVSHGWRLTRPLHASPSGNWGLAGTRAGVTYEVRGARAWVGVFVHEEA